MTCRILEELLNGRVRYEAVDGEHFGTKVGSYLVREDEIAVMPPYGECKECGKPYPKFVFVVERIGGMYCPIYPVPTREDALFLARGLDGYGIDAESLAWLEAQRGRSLHRLELLGLEAWLGLELEARVRAGARCPARQP